MPSILSLTFASACTSLSASEAKALCESIGRSGGYRLGGEMPCFARCLDKWWARRSLIVGLSGNPPPIKTKTRWKRCQDLTSEVLRMRHAVRDESQ